MHIYISIFFNRILIPTEDKHGLIYLVTFRKCYSINGPLPSNFRDRFSFCFTYEGCLTIFKGGFIFKLYNLRLYC